MKKLYIVGTGSGALEDFTIRAYQTINKSDRVYCDELMYTKIKDHFDQSKLIPNEYTKTKTRCINAINSANDGYTTSILGSGDTGIYGISSIIFELIQEQNLDIEVNVIPGMTSLLSGAASLGSPITRDFALVSLSDNFTEEETLKQKLITLAQTDLILIFYSPCNPTKRNIELAKEILTKYRGPNTIIGIASHLGEPTEENITTNLELIPLDKIDAFSTIFVGNQDTYLTMTKKMVTPLTKNQT